MQLVTMRCTWQKNIHSTTKSAKVTKIRELARAKDIRRGITRAMKSHIIQMQKVTKSLRPEM